MSEQGSGAQCAPVLAMPLTKAVNPFPSQGSCPTVESGIAGSPLVSEHVIGNTQSVYLRASKMMLSDLCLHQ